MAFGFGMKFHLLGVIEFTLIRTLTLKSNLGYQNQTLLGTTQDLMNDWRNTQTKKNRKLATTIPKPNTAEIKNRRE